MTANEKQIAGEHYKSNIQHWDYVIANELDYFQAQITKYVTRWKKKGGIQDLKKAQHFLEKYIEVEENHKQPVLQVNLKDFPVKDFLYIKSAGMTHPFGYHHEQEVIGTDAEPYCPHPAGAVQNTGKDD